MVYEMFSFVANLAIFCLQECRINCLFTTQLKRRLMKTANQDFIGFNEQSITFYISDTNFFVYMFPVRKVYIYQNNIPSYPPYPPEKI